MIKYTKTFFNNFMDTYLGLVHHKEVACFLTEREVHIKGNQWWWFTGHVSIAFI